MFSRYSGLSCSIQVKSIFGYNTRPNPGNSSILKLPNLSFPRHDPVHEQLSDLFGNTWLPYWKWREFLMGISWIILLQVMKTVGNWNRYVHVHWKRPSNAKLFKRHQQVSWTFGTNHWSIASQQRKANRIVLRSMAKLIRDNGALCHCQQRIYYDGCILSIFELPHLFTGYSSCLCDNYLFWALLFYVFMSGLLILKSKFHSLSSQFCAMIVLNCTFSQDPPRWWLSSELPPANPWS